MKVVKKVGNAYKDANGVERHYDNFYIELDNGTRIAIRCTFKTDYAKLNTIAEKD